VDRENGGGEGFSDVDGQSKNYSYSEVVERGKKGTTKRD
jgi:hypothetical protein